MTYEITIHAYDFTEAEAEALFERVAEAAHALGGQVACYGREVEDAPPGGGA